MRWITTDNLENWANTLNARAELATLLGQMVRASASDLTSFRFPLEDDSQLKGWDGELDADPQGGFQAFVPSGHSVWEFGTNANPQAKAESDWETRKQKPGAGIEPVSTTFVFVTPRRWPGKAAWRAAKLAEGSPWKEIRVLDAVDLVAWSELCPAAAATFARTQRWVPPAGVVSVDEFWDNYAARFTPPLNHTAVLAGRAEESKRLLQDLLQRSGALRYRGDSIEEVLGFFAATILTAPTSEREFLRSRTLVVDTVEAARQLVTQSNLLFAARGPAAKAGVFGNSLVFYPQARDSNHHDAVLLHRPSRMDLTEALLQMGLPQKEAERLPYACGRSVTVLARRIANVECDKPSWCEQGELIPALLAGGWDNAFAPDRELLTMLAGADDYYEVEKKFRVVLRRPDSPLENVGSVWHVSAPVDMYAYLEELCGEEHFTRLKAAAELVFAELDPALDLPVSERLFRYGAAPLVHSGWLRNGLATTLLMLAATAETGKIFYQRQNAQIFVNSIISSIPGLASDWRVLASFGEQLPMLMEAAPRPFLDALEQLLGGDGAALKPIFRDSQDAGFFSSSSPHTGLLWALEIAGQDPEYLPSVANILARLAEIDPGGSLGNRPAGSLRSLLLVWKPLTNAPPAMRMAVLERLITDHPEVGWKLSYSLVPHTHESAFMMAAPRFKDQGLSEREVLTWPILYKTQTHVIQLAADLAGTDADRWALLLEKFGSRGVEDLVLLVDRLEAAVEAMDASKRQRIWEPLARHVRRHIKYAAMPWAMAADQVARLDQIQQQIAPRDEAALNGYLFKQSLADLPGADVAESMKLAEEKRREVVARLLKQSGIDRVLELAAEVKEPGMVGHVLGEVADDVGVLSAALDVGEARRCDEAFLRGLSGAALLRFAEEWKAALADRYRSGTLSPASLSILIGFWPNCRSLWDWLAMLGFDLQGFFWKTRQAWGMEAQGADLHYAVEQYLLADRAEFIVDALSHRARELTTAHIVASLEAFEQRVGVHPELLRGQMASYHVKLMFSELRKRQDVGLEQVAVLEYRYLPLLRESWSEVDSESALDRFMSENPAFFMQIIDGAFRPHADRDMERSEVTPQQQAQAHTSFTLLQTFARVPGLQDGRIDRPVLEKWVHDVRELAAVSDRAEVAETYIGSLLSRSPADATDQIWPAREVRELLEVWQSNRIEQGILMALFNSRGVTSRGPFDGGQQERVLAGQYRESAGKLDAWPRIRGLLFAMAQRYEGLAADEDQEVDQLRLRE